MALGPPGAGPVMAGALGGAKNNLVGKTGPSLGSHNHRDVFGERFSPLFLR